MRGLRYDPHTGRWVVRKSKGGVSIYKTFTVKADALDLIRNLEREDAGLAQIRKPISLEAGMVAYFEGLRERGGSSETARHYVAKFRQLVKAFGPRRQLHAVTQTDISGYVNLRRGEGVGNRTIRCEVALLHRTSRRAGVVPSWAIPPLRIPRNPRRAPPPSEVAALWRELWGPPRSWLALSLLTGVRPSEALRLAASDVDHNAMVIRVGERKTPDVAYVAMVPTLEACLPIRGLLVPATLAALRSSFVRASARAGIPRWAGAGLGRHCFASWCAQFGGYTTEQIADALGHRRPGLATPGYIHAQAVEPMRRPMSELVERLLLDAVGG